MSSNIYIHAVKGSENIIYNAIHDPVSDNYCYPDILIKHTFLEKAISNSRLYTLANTAIKEYGSSGCFFIMYRDEEVFIEFLENLNHIFTPQEDDLDINVLTNFGEMLMLSATMTNSLKTLLNYYAVSGNDLKLFIQQCVDEYELPVTTKLKGKQIYELIRSKIIS